MNIHRIKMIKGKVPNPRQVLRFVLNILRLQTNNNNKTTKNQSVTNDSNYL